MSFVSEHNSLPAEKKTYNCDGCLFFLKDWDISLHTYGKLTKYMGVYYTIKLLLQM